MRGSAIIKQRNERRRREKEFQVDSYLNILGTHLAKSTFHMMDKNGNLIGVCVCVQGCLLKRRTNLFLEG